MVGCDTGNNGIEFISDENRTFINGCSGIPI